MRNCGNRALRMCDAAAWRLAAAAVIAASGVAGCGAGEPEADSPRARGAPPENHAATAGPADPHPSAAGDTAGTHCPATGLWAECSVIERLENAGLGVEVSQNKATEAPLDQQGTAFSVRNAELEVYIYPSRAARERDQARLERAGYLHADAPPGLTYKPTLVASENLLVVLDTRRERQRERITLALTAGPPQPPGP